MGANPQPFTRQSAAFAETTPFLRDVFGLIAGPGIDSRIAWIVDDLALLLDRADMAAILRDFGARSRREDPVVHFYEAFLVAYDPKLREMRGVYYTPEPIVSYIVRSVDWLLRDRFGLAAGLAATVAEGTDGSHVLILDPAAGTGTFLREVAARIRDTVEEMGLGGVWPDYVRTHLLPRLFGFELLMAPYAICHLKLALEIGGAATGFKMPHGQRLGVFLTNTLERGHEYAAAGRLFAHEIAREAAGADAVKREKPVMVVLGNPPYSGHSRNKGVWISNLIDTYKNDPELKKPAQSKWLNDDYVKFIRFAQWRIERTGEGILGFVTNHKYLNNPTFRVMRRSLMETFDEIYLLDLHGNSNNRERAPDGSKDENVFDIKQGVAIGLFVKRGDPGNGLARVVHADLWGKQELSAGFWHGKIAEILYRPFDIRTTVLNRNVAVHVRKRVTDHMLAGANLGLSTTRSIEIAVGWEHVFVSSAPIQHHTVSSKEVNYLFPLYKYSLGRQRDFTRGREPNLGKAFIEKAQASLGLEFLLDGRGDLTTTFGPVDIFHYIYAVLHSPEYRRRYADFLKSDFPRVPLTDDQMLFAALVDLGQNLVSLHLMETEGKDFPRFPHRGTNHVDKVRYAPPSFEVGSGRVWVNSDQYFDGVEPKTWAFSIGGYRPAEKWLKDRKNRILSFDDIVHYRRICAALTETGQLMARIDKTIEENGGWPLGSTTGAEIS